MHKFILGFALFLAGNNGNEYVKVKMNKRVHKAGVTSSVDAEIFYSMDGKMVTRYLGSKEIIIINNSDGELTMYDKKANTVLQNINYTFSTENSNFFYFLGSEKRDMGLEKMGFLLEKSEFEEGMLVSTWMAPLEMAKHFSNIKLVHEYEKPIYMDYKDHKGKVLKKIYFSGFIDINNKSFPTSITEINYVKKDSIVSKTVFSNFEFDLPHNENLLNFEIPKDAKYIKE